MNLETLLRVPYVDPYNGFDLSPDGSRAAFSWNISGQWEIYEMVLPSPSKRFAGISVPVGGHCRASSGEGAKTAPRYSPDNTYLAWMLDVDGSENFHIVVEDLLEGLSVNLNENIQFAIQPFIAWSPDSRQIAYLADKKGIFDLYLRDFSPLLPGDGPGVRSDRFLFASGGPATNVVWSPDGAHLAVTAEKEWQTSGLFIVPSDGGAARRVSGDATPLDASHPAWSPDGQRLAFASTSSGWSRIGIYDLANERIEWVAHSEGDEIHPAWSPDGAHLCWVHVQNETAWVEVTALGKNQPPRQLQPGKGFCYRPKFTADGGSVVFVYEDPHHPPDLWLASVSDGRLTQLTDSLPSSLRGSKFVMPEAVTYPSLDGTPVPALLYKSASVGPNSPAIVFIHGGPNWHLPFIWYPLITDMAARGWTVIAPNYRGSTGYGQDWLKSNRFEMGRLDTDDCAAAALYLAKEGLADPTRIGVTGRSHGGYLTMSCLTRHPELWAVGAAVVPFLNWFTGHENSREDLQFWDVHNMGDPATHHDLWHDRSPFFFLDQVRSPVQLIAGENDPRCPPSESVEAHKKLQELGIESELILYEDEGHAFMKVENVIDSEVKRVEFLTKVLEK